MTNPSRSTNVTRYGSDLPLPVCRDLRAGPVQAILEGGDLRYIRLGDHEIVRRLYVAIRDRNWNTVPPVFTTYEADIRSDSFRIDLEVEHVSADADFAWSGSIEGRPDGTIEYALTGAPRKRFYRNRIGFCVLHPADLAGVPAITTTPEGPVGQPFPDLISPHQPFIDMTSIAYAAGPTATATIAFQGDLFEMEDQRNWTDASYKTYSTPLRIPYPVEVGPEDKVSQKITISVEGTSSPSDQAKARLQVKVDPTRVNPLPAIGFGAGRKGTIAESDVARLRALSPAHLWLGLDLGSENWRQHLVDAAGRADTLGTSLDLSVLASASGGWSDLAAFLTEVSAPVGRIYAFPPADDPVVFPRFDLATHPETIQAARSAFAAAGVDAQIGGGSRAYFTELNRATDFLPVTELDAITYTLNPQVHASDNLSVVETLSGQAETVRSARAIAGSKPLIVGPITLQPPWNPNATEPAPATPDDQLPPEVDARQLSLLGAGWTLGSIHRIAEAGADALTFYELYGWRGLMERRRDLSRRELFPSEPGQLFPLYHVFAAIASFAPAELAHVSTSEPFQVEALALRRGDSIRLLVASFAEESKDVQVDLPGLAKATFTVLDEETWDVAAFDPQFLNRPSGAALAVRGGSVSLAIRPFGVVRIDGELLS